MSNQYVSTRTRSTTTRDTSGEETERLNKSNLSKWLSAVKRVIHWPEPPPEPPPDPFLELWKAIDTVGGFLATNQERWLYEAAKATPANGLIVEVGSFLGRSTVSMAFGCLETARRIVAIDTFEGNSDDFINGKNNVSWEGSDFFNVFWQHLTARDLAVYVIPIRGMSHDVGRMWSAPINLLFLDGSHNYEDVKQDLELFLPWVVPGGCVAMHDVTEGWPGVYRVWDEIAKPALVQHGNVGSLSYGFKPSIRDDELSHIKEMPAKD